MISNEIKILYVMMEDMERTRLIVPSLQATGSVPDPEGLHRLPAGRGVLPGSGSSGCSAAHAHACRGERHF